MTEAGLPTDAPRVLVVDDDEVPRMVISTFLEQAGFTPITANDGEEASRILERNPVDLVITDLDMPRKNGLQLITEIQEKNPALPVIIITGESRVEAAVKCMRLGAFDYINKPFELDKLKEGVTKAIEKRRELIELAISAPSSFICLNARRLFPGYKIIRAIAEGGFSVVFLATDAQPNREHPDRYYALKVFKTSLRQKARILGKAEERFYGEGKFIRGIRHPHIIEIVDFGTTGDEKIPFIVMEYFKGRTLKHYTTNPSELNYRQKASILRQVADALAVIHDHGIVHRDIKPDNVLVDDDLTVKLGDFGIARFPESHLTLSHELLGSPAYMAPESFETAGVGPAADIFSLGVVAYELLLGQKPFNATNIPNYAEQIKRQPHADPTSIDPNLPKALSRIVSRMLQKIPEKRYPTAHHLVAALDQFIEKSETGTDAKT